jgi:hypothetical protein
MSVNLFDFYKPFLEADRLHEVDALRSLIIIGAELEALLFSKNSKGR